MNNTFILKKIKHSLSLILILSLGFSLIVKNQVLAQENEDNNTICYENIEDEINKVIESPEYNRANWGIMVKELNNEEIIYSLNGNNYFLHASNAKLITTAAALLKFGQNYRFQTPIFLTENDNNIYNLKLIGQGDPSLISSDLEEVALKLQEENITDIEKLIIEENNANNLGINPTWEWDDIYYYYAVNVNSLILNENAVVLKVLPQAEGEIVDLIWSDDIASNQWNVINTATTAAEDVPYNVSINGILGDNILEISGEIASNSPEDIWGLSILNPSQYFLDSFTAILEEKSINICQSLISNLSSQDLENERLLMNIESPLMSELITKTNIESNNLFAEALFQLLGNESNEENTLKETLTELGVEANSYYLKDGSGLSRHNLVSPQALIQTLDLMAQTSVAKIYKDSLPIAGINGTLKRRFTNTFLENNLQAKTGTLSGTSTLSGYLKTREGEELVFSILVNNSNQYSSVLRQGIDKIALIFSETKQCN